MTFLVRTVKPALPAVYLADIKMHARVDLDDEDPALVSYVEAATDLVEEMSGRRLVTQTWAQTQGQVPGLACIELDVHPVQSISSIAYYDTSEAVQSATVGDFNLYKDDDRAFVEPATGNSWPGMYDRPDALTITFVAGYGGQFDIPAGLIQAVSLLTAHYFEHRSSALGQDLAELPFGVAELVNIHRRGWVGA